MKKLVQHSSLIAGVALVTIVFGTIYGTVQQSYRQDANDPQIQLAEDTADQLSRGVVQPVAAQPNVRLETSLAPFTIVYDENGYVLSSSATLNGKTPSLPIGVLKSTTPAHENHVTWQPQPRVRVAAVVVATKNSPKYYVLSGRSLREVEKREDQLTLAVGIGWSLSIVLFSAAYRLSRLEFFKH